MVQKKSSWLKIFLVSIPLQLGLAILGEAHSVTELALTGGDINDQTFRSPGQIPEPVYHGMMAMGATLLGFFFLFFILINAYLYVVVYSYYLELLNIEYEAELAAQQNKAVCDGAEIERGGEVVAVQEGHGTQFYQVGEGCHVVCPAERCRG